jgi:hypothetical protein
MISSNTSSELMQPAVSLVTHVLTAADHWDHFLARWGINRNGHRVQPGLYKLNDPTPESPVFVTANYTLSFDALRSALDGTAGYILVLDTRGVNVWCAAGKGTFGTDELVNRIAVTGLHEVVSHRRLILPQLGAPGVSAHQVKSRAGFRVDYGPVRASDLAEYLRLGKATPEMRQVHFGLLDRLILIPVELVHVVLPMVIAAVLLFFVGGLLAALGAVASVLAGVALFPILLPCLPTREFSTKGFILGELVALPFILIALFEIPTLSGWRHIGWALAYQLAMPPVTAYLALNFTGSTTFTSRTGVRRELFRYTPIMAGMFGLGIFLTIILLLMP